MRFWISILFSCLQLLLLADNDIECLPSSSEHIAEKTLDTDILIGHLVSPLTGQLSIAETDMIAKGAESISLKRVYIPPHLPSFKDEDPILKEYLFAKCIQKNYQGWRFLPHCQAYFFPNQNIVRLTDPSGITLEFCVKNSKTEMFSSTFGMSNVSSGKPGGQYELRNTQITLTENNLNMTVQAPDGTIRYYKCFLRAPGKLLYALEKEILLHGKLLRYHYADGYLKSIESMDLGEQHIYASIRLDYEKSKIHFSSSTGQTTSYTYDKRRIQIDTKHKQKKIKANMLLSPLLTHVSSPSYRHEKIQYSPKHLLEMMSGKEKIFHCVHKEFEAKQIPPHFRISQLRLPVGSNDAFEIVHECYYAPPRAGKQEGATYVKNADGTETTYHFSRNLLLERLQYRDEKGTLQKEKLYHYRQSPDHWLEVIEIQDAKGCNFYKKIYTYDRFGNPTTETVSGDLTGNGTEESYTIQRSYSEDGKHLLLTEDHEDGRSYHYSYLPGTNLVTAKFSLARGKVYIREFYEYDNYCNLIKKIYDDGSSIDKTDFKDVTERFTTIYTLRQNQPFLHLPEWIEELSLQGLLKKTHLHYDEHGNIKQKQIYDANGEFAFSLDRTYNERGDIRTDSNPLNDWKTFDHDPRGRQKFESSFSGRLLTHKTYDLRGRMREKKETGETINRITKYDYNWEDFLVNVQDHLGHITEYKPDLILKKPTHIIFPPISSLPVEKKITYDILGKEIISINPRGHATKTSYNFYGSPTKITYPDGSIKSFRYYKNGKLKCQTDQEGLSILHTYDPLWRQETKTFISEKGEELAKEVFTYSNFHLKTSTDKEGNITYYDYDHAGRKSKETLHDRETNFLYDPLSRLSQIIQEPLITHFNYDLWDQLIEKKETDLEGQIFYKINYTYDKDGNQKTTTRYVHNKKTIDAFSYDPLGRQTEHRDPLGFVRKTTYNESNNDFQIIETDPKGFTITNTYDAHNNLIKKRTSLGMTDLSYDPCSNLLERTDQGSGTQTIRYTYTPMNYVETLLRATGTAHQRKTTYTYTPSGKIRTKTLPNSIVLHFDYFPLGLLEKLTSSDHTIYHTFTYNLLGDLLTATDHINDTSITRSPDPFGNLLQEEFSTGLIIQKSYDRFNRPLTMTFPKNGIIRYAYNPCYLQSIERFDNSNRSLYIHTYEKYDLSGKLTRENLIGNLGQVVHKYDKAGHIKQLISPYFTEECAYDALGNLEKILKNATLYEYTYDALSQISSEPQNHYHHDALYNRIEKNSKPIELNALNELVSGSYDDNGNMKTLGNYQLSYDVLNRLSEITSSTSKIAYLYDPLNRRLTKDVYARKEGKWHLIHSENYLYDGEEEIGAVAQDDSIRNLKVGTAAIELLGKPFAPIFDTQNNICCLIDPITQQLAATYTFTAFGEELYADDPMFNPWRYASKRLDLETGLIYFGKRYYDPTLGRWLTTDPAGFTDSINPYQYVFNNPLRYIDPNGEFAIPLLIWAIGAALPSISAAITTAAYAAAAITACYVGHKAVEYANDHLAYHSTHDMIWSPISMWKNTEIASDSLLSREEPKNLNEQLALEEAKTKPQDPDDEIMKDKIKDPKYPTEQWKKVEHIHERPNGSTIDIHYWENRLTGEKHGFKFKNK